MAPVILKVVESLATIGFTVLMSFDSLRISWPPLCAAGCIGNALSNCDWNSSRVIDFPMATVAGLATGEAPGEATGDAPGDANGDAIGEAVVTGEGVGVRGKGLAVGVGVSLLLPPPHAASSNGSNTIIGTNGEMRRPVLGWINLMSNG